MTQISDLADPSGFEKEHYIRLLYEVVLQRTPDPEGLSGFLEREDVHNFFLEVVTSPEFQSTARDSSFMLGLRSPGPTRPRILLFGAYGNGNLGDKIQAESLLRAINHVRPDIEVWACSALSGNYTFPFDRVLPAGTVNDPRVVNEFDLLMIGGGGLFSHPHDLLTNLEWQEAIKIPVALIGVGATEEIVQQSATLIKKAFYISVRDAESMVAVQNVSKNVQFLPDPVLCDAYYDIRADTRSRERRRGRRKLWILKYVDIEQLRQWPSIVDPQNDEVCFIEPHMDFPLISAFPLAKPVYRADDLIGMIDGADIVLSMRYHGCILAMLRDRPTIAIREQKSLELLRRYGNGSYFSPTVTNDFGDLCNYVPPGDFLVRDRARFISTLSTLLVAIKGDNTLTGVKHDQIETHFEGDREVMNHYCDRLLTDRPYFVPADITTTTYDPVSKRDVEAATIIPSHESFIHSIYLGILNREPDPGGLAYHLDQLTNGRVGRRELTLSLLASSEFQTQAGLPEFLRRPNTPTAMQVYSGYCSDDLKLFSAFDTTRVCASPGFLTDWIGSRVRVSSLWDGVEHADGTVQALPIPCDYHAETIEWIGTLKAVIAAGKSFSVMELGAGHGPWLAASCAAARARGIEELHLCGVEADPGRFALLQQNLADNDLSGVNTLLVQGAIGIEPGRARWPRIVDPRNHSGARPLRDGNSEDAAYLGSKYAEMIDVEIVALGPLLRGRPLWDLVHIDIQGTEVELCRVYLNDLSERARYLVIGTHSRKIDGDLMELLLGGGWRLEHEKPTRIVCDPGSVRPVTRTDGAQVWRNHRLGPDV